MRAAHTGNSRARRGQKREATKRGVPLEAALLCLVACGHAIAARYTPRLKSHVIKKKQRGLDIKESASSSAMSEHRETIVHQ